MARFGGLFEHVPAVARQRRQQLGLTQGEVARRARVSKSAVSRIENGKGASFDFIDRVLAVLGLEDWMETLKAFAEASRKHPRYVTYDLGEPVAPQVPIVLRLRPGQQDAVAFEVQSGHRRLLCAFSVYDFTPNLQQELPPGE